MLQADVCAERRVRAGLILAAVVAGAVALGGCGGASSSSSSVPVSSSVSSSATRSPAARNRRPRHRRRPRLRGAPIGTAQHVDAGSSTLTVTVTRVYGSLAGTGAALLPGTHAAGIQLTIRTDAGSTYDSTASGDVSAITSSGTAAPLFIKQGPCQTQLTDFESLIGVGETHSGCVGFTVPHGARVVGVRFSPHSRAPGSVTWR
jgi:hypothetical protein